ncbi:nucleoside-diphosphate sugar epimerase/dehydratase [Roseisolibacter sp. H3M3-2]|uniref:polysaccharide biosynthesis protein n=1 Tax=Roseisolibacter sp. H3M3-2 TaxID=3031323 RepID=UPI0023DCD46F|nr:nucleoside-diphosphate sugar epimerase/dehydratase [Roseisolibacter sp. H3M3-2]MDF1502337.1 nucleoside-diphosphate sugar epimerase/dehydratase [Roseisolibacter sp. H3M3-2]
MLGHLRNRYLLVLDALALPAAALLAYMVRFEGLDWPTAHVQSAVLFVLVVVPLKLAVMWALGLYQRMWRYASTPDLEVLATSSLGSTVVGVVVGLVLVPALFDDGTRVPVSVVALDALLGSVLVAAPRLWVRVRTRRRRPSETARRVLVAGAGAGGSLIVRELLDNPQLRLVPVAFVDDDPAKRKRGLHGIPVVGALDDLAAAAERMAIDEVVIAMPSAPGQVVRRVVKAAGEAGIPARMVPGLFELIDGRKSVSGLREVNIEDLLRREPVRTDLAQVRTLAEGRTVLVTGAGGSIGSELCRQLARLNPSRIVAVGRGENSIFELLQDLTRLAPDVPVSPVIADVRDVERMDRLFRQYSPSTVFHAAAHKHVPLMEQNVAEALLNNVYGTQVVAELSYRYGADRFVLISSDKAVRPSSVMGATKRLAEGVVQRYAGAPGRHFVSVRFGNVLGSRGSVIPTFLRQIQAGGPVTITHREMRRYFMTIPEAVQLVLQAGILAEDSEVFVLDMGEPVLIYDLARDVIRLSGLEVGTDIEIRETGIRPGEKLYEELFFDAEHASPTSHPKVLRAKHAELPLANAETLEEMYALAASGATNDEVRVAIKRLVPEFTGGSATESPRAVEAPRQRETSRHGRRLGGVHARGAPPAAIVAARGAAPEGVDEL